MNDTFEHDVDCDKIEHKFELRSMRMKPLNMLLIILYFNMEMNCTLC